MEVMAKREDTNGKPGRDALRIINTVMLTAVLGVGGWIAITVLDVRDRIMKLEWAQQDVGRRLSVLESTIFKTHQQP